MTSTQPLLDVRAVSVRTRSFRIVDDVSFDLRAGEIVALIGPNGAGKTTLLEAVVGLRLRQAGTIAFRGHPLVHFSDSARTFAFMPDDAIPPGELDVRTVVDAVLRERPRRELIVTDLAEQLRIVPLRDKPLGILSRGERKRVTLFVALALDRPVVVLDEPFGAFDPVQMREVERAVRLVTADGAAVLTSIHQMPDAERVSDRIILLAHGRRVAFGTRDELYRRADAASLEEVFVRLLRESPDVTA
jgi:ABC-type multidrug transport system ATPase subunit